MGTIEGFELPFMGHEIQQGQDVFHVYRRNQKMALQMPVSGIVSAINLAAKEKSALVIDDPYASGWLFKVQTSNLRQDLKNLTLGSESVDWLNREIDRLNHEIESIGRTSTENTPIDNDPSGRIPPIDWERLGRLFLHTA